MEYDFNDDGYSFVEEKRKKDAEALQTAELPAKPDISAIKAETKPKSYGGSSSNSSNGANATNSENSSNSEYSSIDEVAEPAPIDVVSSSASVENASEKSDVKKPGKYVKTPRKPVDKTAITSAVNLKQSVKQDSAQTQVEFIKNVPVGVMNAMRRLFPSKLTNADLISAFVYVHTDGACEISERAKVAVEKYGGDKSNIDVVSKLAKIERELSALLTLGSEIELATSFIITDRLFSIKRAANPKIQNLRDSQTLDMLENIRKSGRAQEKLDSETKGRDIHESRSVNDYAIKKGNNPK